MHRVNSFFSNILIIILLLALGLGVTWFVTNQIRQPATQQKPEATPALSNLVNTPQPTRVVTVIPVVVTIIPTPTPAPSPTPTPTFEPLSDKPIMGFVFKPPQEVPNTRHQNGFQIIDWLPGSSKEVLLQGAKSLEVVNVLSGTTKVYATTNAPGDISPQPIWLPEKNGVAYIAWESGKQNLWLGQEGGKKELLFTDTEPPLIPLGQGRNIAIYSKNDGNMKNVSPDNKQQSDKLPSVIDRLSRSKPGPPGTIRRVVIQPNGDWIAYYNAENFQMFNTQTGEIKTIELGGNEFQPLWAMDAKWSPDGKRLALTVTQGQFPISFSDLYILEWPAATLHKVDNNFTYVTDIAWSPDSQHLLIGAVIGRDGYGVNITALYITNVSNSSEILPVPIPTDGLGIDYGGGLAWSPDGKKVLVKYFDDLGGSLYQIDVTTQ